MDCIRFLFLMFIDVGVLFRILPGLTDSMFPFTASPVYLEQNNQLEVLL